MKTLCVAVVLLSLTSVCQPAPLACEKLLKPGDLAADVTGRWYFIAVAADSCLLTSLLNAVFWPSLAVDIVSTGLPKVYDSKLTVKVYGYCESESAKIWVHNNTVFDISSNDSTDAPTGKPGRPLQSSCPDCMVIKMEDTVMFFSRRKTVTGDEMKEFQTQVRCMGWFKPQVFNTDHEYANCPSVDNFNDADSSRLSIMIYERLNSTYEEPLQCLTESLLYYPKAGYEWAQQSWASFW